MNAPTAPASVPDAQDALSVLLKPVTLAQQILDAATETFHAAQQGPWNALRYLIDAGTDFGHPLMPIVLNRALSSVGSGPGFLPAATKALGILRLIETPGTEFCIAFSAQGTRMWQVWYGICSGKVEIANPPEDDPCDARNRITFPFDVKSYGHNHGIAPLIVAEEDRIHPIGMDMAYSIVSRMAGASPIACNCIIAFGTEEIAAMTNQSSQWDNASLARSVVDFGRKPASPLAE